MWLPDLVVVGHTFNCAPSLGVRCKLSRKGKGVQLAVDGLAVAVPALADDAVGCHHHLVLSDACLDLYVELVVDADDVACPREGREGIGSHGDLKLGGSDAERGVISHERHVIDHLLHFRSKLEDRPAVDGAIGPCNVELANHGRKERGADHLAGVRARDNVRLGDEGPVDALVTRVVRRIELEVCQLGHHVQREVRCRQEVVQLHVLSPEVRYSAMRKRQVRVSARAGRVKVAVGTCVRLVVPVACGVEGPAGAGARIPDAAIHMAAAGLGVVLVVVRSYVAVGAEVAPRGDLTRGLDGAEGPGRGGEGHPIVTGRRIEWLATSPGRPPRGNGAVRVQTSEGVLVRDDRDPP
mmetsp:Transcript_72811/g.144693  ORF Transcript_72811/g.144693 Transcript_72811/m.144693 type:complete len:353 (-) Transcript_72811:1185-2243(-)